jgi:hypothetical protein
MVLERRTRDNYVNVFSKRSNAILYSVEKLSERLSIVLLTKTSLEFERINDGWSQTRVCTHIIS